MPALISIERGTYFIRFALLHSKLWPRDEFSQLFGTLTSILLKSRGKLLVHSRVPLLFFFGPLYLMFKL